MSRSKLLKVSRLAKIDRLARSVRHLCEIVDRLQAKGVALRLLKETAGWRARL
jgi:DNA invertase Pin-like site-specific DNA recombinase